MKASELLTKIEELIDVEGHDVEVFVLSSRTGDVHHVYEVWLTDNGIEIQAASI